MNRNMLETIEYALDFIESNLNNKLNLLEIAQTVHMSKYHLHRLLSHAVGQSLMNYIRARKLSASIELLLESRYSIIDVSNYLAFEHEQSYIRAFKKQYGMTPGHFRKEMPELSLTEKADLSHLTEVHDGLIFTPTIVFKPAMNLVGPRHKIYMADDSRDFTANRVAHDFSENLRNSIKHKINDHIYIGYSKYESWQEETYNYYFPSVQVSSFEEAPPYMEKNLLQGSKYAVFTYIGGFHPKHLTSQHLKEIWEYIVNYVRLNKPSFYQSEPFHFEYIDENLATDRYCEVDLHFPIHSLPVRPERE